MRITHNMSVSNFLLNINRTRERIDDLQVQIASGKRVAKPSDDPYEISSIQRLSSLIEHTEQYQQNVGEGNVMLLATENALDQAHGVLVEIKEILVAATNGIHQADTFRTFGEQVGQKLNHLIDIANTRFNGKYLFGGTQTLTKPYTLGATVTANPAGISGNIQLDIMDGTKQTINISGEEAFQGATILDLIRQIRDTLQSGSQPTSAQMDQLDDAIDHVLEMTGKAGAMVQQLNAVEGQLERQQLELKQLLSLKYDTDTAEAIVKLKQQELALEAALNAGASILQKSLLDFLR